MTDFGASAMTFLCTFGAAMIATAVRSLLPPPHMSKETQDVVRLGMGLVATMTALLLGLVTATAKGSFDSQAAAMRSVATGIVTLDRHLARYGPEAGPIREEVRSVVAARIEAIWPATGPGGGLDSMKGPAPAEKIEDQILALAPANDTQRWLKSQALALCEDVLRTRTTMVGNAAGSVPRPFLLVVIFWLMMTFASFGLYAPRNATVIAVLFVAALSVAAAVFLVLELDDPFTGVIRISSGPMRSALAALGH